MSVEKDDPTAPLDLDRFEADARALGEADFAARHGLAFLLHQGQLDPNRRALRPQQTLVIGRSDAPPPPDSSRGTPTATAPSTRPASVGARSLAGLLVYPVKHTGRSPFPRIVTVGRTKNNDVVFADISVSKFHAFFKEDGGAFSVTDGESRNGTYVDGERVLTTKQGKPTLLRSGARVKFGGLDFRFIDTRELLSIVRQFG